MLFSEEQLPTATQQKYRVLARKYRPQFFSALIGQENLVRTLKNAFRVNKVAHAFMLTGVRGIGKTTTARLIAKALNCEQPFAERADGFEPCGVCSNCLQIADSRHVDVLEMDAASRTGIDDIREIIDSVRYGPVAAPYKVYIIDEVHMLSRQAFNALLKTLEEPPPHAKFIFATTEIRKVPLTILSRCQRFDLRRVEKEPLAAYLQEICAKEAAEADSESLLLLGRAADGSVRDALSLLDQAIARGDGGVNLADTKEMLGLADRGMVFDLLHHVVRGEVQQTLSLCQQFYDHGAEPLILVQDMLDMVHALTRLAAMEGVKKAVDIEEIVDLPQKEAKELALLLGVPGLTRCWQLLLKGVQEIPLASNPQKAFEMILLRLLHLSHVPPPAELIHIMKQQAGKAVARNASVGANAMGVNAVAAPRHDGGGSHGSMALQMQPEIQAQTPEIQAQTIVLPTNMQEIYQLLLQLSPILASNLRRHASLVRLDVSRQPPMLEYFVVGNAPANMAQQLMTSLQKVTSVRWMVSIAPEKGELTLAEMEEKSLQAKNEAIASHEVVAQLLQEFSVDSLVLEALPTTVEKLAVTETDGYLITTEKEDGDNDE
ncbi:MAG: DNA polymerase III subunit gamma/tau [Alphaproteobacteria bacterium]